MNLTRNIILGVIAGVLIAIASILYFGGEEETVAKQDKPATTQDEKVKKAEKTPVAPQKQSNGFPEIILAKKAGEQISPWLIVLKEVRKGDIEAVNKVNPDLNINVLVDEMDSPYHLADVGRDAIIRFYEAEIEEQIYKGSKRFLSLYLDGSGKTNCKNIPEKALPGNIDIRISKDFEDITGNFSKELNERISNFFCALRSKDYDRKEVKNLVKLTEDAKTAIRNYFLVGLKTPKKEKSKKNINALHLIQVRAFFMLGLPF